MTAIHTNPGQASHDSHQSSDSRCPAKLIITNRNRPTKASVSFRRTGPGRVVERTSRCHK